MVDGEEEKKECETQLKILKKYEQAINIWKRWDESYWNSFNIFILTISILFAAYSQVYNQRIISLIITFSGIIISLIWFAILNRKYIHIVAGQLVAKNLEQGIYGNFIYSGCFSEIDKINDSDFIVSKYIHNNDGKKKWQLKASKISSKIFSSGFLSAFVFPILIALTWGALFIYSLLIDC